MNLTRLLNAPAVVMICGCLWLGPVPARAADRQTPAGPPPGMIDLTACAVVGQRVGFAAIQKLPEFQVPDRYVNQTRPQLPRESKVSEQAELMLRLSERLILCQRRPTALARRQARLPYPAAGSRTH